MSNDPTRSASAVSRRTALAGLGAGSLGLLLAARGHSVSAQEATPGVPVTPEAATPMATPTAEGQTATINGADLYYVVRGDAAGPPVLLLHGAIGNTEEWHNVSPALVDAGYRVVLMDCRGRGRSTWGDRPITFAQMAADALGLLDLLGIAKTRLVGWSDGGIIGLELAITHPDRLNRAVLYGANFTPDGVYPDGPHPSDQLPPFKKFVADYKRLSPEPQRFEELLGVLPMPDYSEDELRSITVPVLILDGAEEEFIKPEETVRMAALIPGAELVIMPGTGHFAPFARPDEFNRIVLAFLAGERVGTPVAATPTA